MFVIMVFFLSLGSRVLRGAGKGKGKLDNLELESFGGEVYIVSFSSTTAEGKYRDRSLKLVFFH